MPKNIIKKSSFLFLLLTLSLTSPTLQAHQHPHSNPPGSQGGAGTNWKNPPGKEGGPGQSRMGYCHYHKCTEHQKQHYEHNTQQ